MAAGDYLEIEKGPLSDWFIVSRSGLVRFSASSNAGQIITAITEDADFEDIDIDTHQAGSVNGSIFTAPRDATYKVSTVFEIAGSMGLRISSYVEGSAIDRDGPTSVSGTNSNTIISIDVDLLAGEEYSTRSTQSGTRSTNTTRNWITISEQP